MVNTSTQEYTTKVSPSRMFKALIIDSHIVFPKIAPQLIKSIEFIHGDGGPGSIKLTTFTESKMKNFKTKIETLDPENYMCKYSMIEGEGLGEKLESISFEIKMEEANNGGCVCKMTSYYETKGDYKFSEEEANTGKEQFNKMFKMIEDYLLANPDVYA